MLRFCLFALILCAGCCSPHVFPPYEATVVAKFQQPYLVCRILGCDRIVSVAVTQEVYDHYNIGMPVTIKRLPGECP